MLRYLKQAKSALSMLNPDEVRARADRRPAVGLVFSSSRAGAEMEEFLAPGAVSRERRREVIRLVHRAVDSHTLGQFDLVLCEEGLPCPADSFPLYRDDPTRTINEILHEREPLGIALARNFYPFRKPVVDHIIASVARENALFAVASALPKILPSLIELPWAVGEFASDTAFITMNQFRMAFMVAAASDRKVGYGEQKAELTSILAGAFGWRALARELAGFMPLGTGLVPKGAIAYAATYVLGKGLEHFYGVGYGYTRAHRRDVYQLAYERGKEVVSATLGRHA